MVKIVEVAGQSSRLWHSILHHIGRWIGEQMGEKHQQMRHASAEKSDADTKRPSLSSAQDNDERSQNEGAEAFDNCCEPKIGASHSKLSFNAVAVELEGFSWHAEE